MSCRTALLLAAIAASACDCDPRLGEISPVLEVRPSKVELTNIAVAQDTPIVLTIRAASFVPLTVVNVELLEPVDPAFRLVEEDWPQTIASTGETTFRVIVRPNVVSTVTATVRVTGEKGTRPLPGYVDVPITVESADLGLPDIHAEPDELEFARIGQGDVVRDYVEISNVGVANLIIDSARLVEAEDDDADYDGPIRLVTTIPQDSPLGSGQGASLELAFAPQDTERHEARLRVDSNDPDEDPLFIPIGGAGSVCPVAVAKLLEDPENIEPLDTVRLDGHDSYHPEPARTIETFEWALEQRPIGSTATLTATDLERVELTADIAGRYVARLHVYDDTEVRSCEASIVTIDVKPKEELHVELVWDHDEADLDLHIVRQGGALFNHDGDVYFSNKEPANTPETPSWSLDPDENPTLDVDDDEGYGPENGAIVDPAAGSIWNIYVHYWRDNTDQDPFTTATLRVYVYGALQTELQQSFSAEETMWQAIEIAWPQEELGPATITPRNEITTFARPF
jgi:hypothetical protein